MTTKTAGKTQEGQPDRGPTQQELQAAYQVHTLAQMLYGQVATTHPWIHPVSPMGMGMVDPTMSQRVAPWVQSWPGNWYGSLGHAGPMSSPWMGPYFFGPDVYPR